ncbi:MAG: class I adenylate-forming enzyme family protein [Gammaproteobacteria bacterium]
MNAVLAALRRWPDGSPALAWPGGGMSYGELRARVDALAHAAAGLGAPDTPLAVVSASRLKIALGVLAALRLGRPALPLDAARPDVAACLAAVGPGGALADAGVPLPPALPRAEFRSATMGSHAAELPGGLPAVGGDPAGAALLVPTSGTSGPAQVAMLSARAMDAHVAASAQVLPPLDPGARWLVCLPMNSIGALAALWRTLSAGACLALLERFDPEDARRLMAEGASHVSVVPAMLQPLAQCRAPAPRGLRCLFSGGGPLPAQAAGLALAQGWPLWTGWGMTETASHLAAGPVDAGWREGIVGRPLPGVELEIEPASGRLVVAGPMLMSGYARPGLQPGAGLEPGGRFLSGDLGEFLADGRLSVPGRADDVIVTGGVNVRPQAVEAVLGACPGAGEVAVTARPDARWGRVLVALYTGEASAATLDAWARERLPSASRPREFRRVAALPRNAMGKLLRSALSLE